MQHLTNLDHREQIYMANLQRASEKNPDRNNILLVYEIIKLKTEMAKMLGYNNFAELSLATKKGWTGQLLVVGQTSRCCEAATNWR
jgi:oligopeptidase A